MQSRNGAKRTRRSRSTWEEKINVGLSYREMSATDLQLNDAGKRQLYADCTERGVQNERIQDDTRSGSSELTESRIYLEHVGDDPDARKRQIYEDCSRSTDCAESGVQNETIKDKAEETKTNDTRYGSNELTESRTYLELVGDDLDAGKQPVNENCRSSAGSAEGGLENRVPGSSRSARMQSRKGAKHTRTSPSSVKEQVHVVFCYPEICPIYLQLKDARKRQIYEDCSGSTDCAENGVQNELIKDKEEETKTYDTISGSDELTETRTYLEIVADDPDEEDVDKYLEPVSLEQKEFSNYVEPNADFPKEPNPEYVNSGIHNVYESLDLSNLPPVYQELKHSTSGAEGLDKDLEWGFLPQNDFSNCVEPNADFPKEPNPDYANSKIYGDRPKNVYETLDLSDLPPVYQELNHFYTTDK